MDENLDIQQIVNGVADLTGPVELLFHSGPENELTRVFGQALRRIEQAAAGLVAVKRGDGRSVSGVPCLGISVRGVERIHYLALPQGPEQGPFLEILQAVSDGDEEAPDDLRARLQLLERPAGMLVFIASACPHCPVAVRSATRVALASDKVEVTVIDAQRFPEIAERFGVKSVPLTVLDEELFITGTSSAEQLADAILSRGSESYGADLFRSLVEGGRLVEAAARLRRGGRESEFLQAWGRSTTSLRIPLLLVCEDVLDEEPTAFDGIVSALVDLLGTEDATLRGDTADLLGRIAHPSALEGLAALCGDPNPDVAEIATEAIEEIRDRARR